MDSNEFRFRLVNTVFGGLLAAFTAFLAYGVIVASETLKVASETLRVASETFSGDHDQRRRVYTMHLYDEWRELLDLTEVRFTLEKIHDDPGFFESNLDQLSDPEHSDDTDNLKQRQHILAVLNLFEQIASASDNNIGDKDIIHELFYDAMQAHYSKLEPFVSEWRRLKGRGSWQPLARYLRESSTSRDPIGPNLDGR